jgi:hypothetical protein
MLVGQRESKRSTGQVFFLKIDSSTKVLSKSRARFLTFPRLLRLYKKIYIFLAVKCEPYADSPRSFCNDHMWTELPNDKK